MTSSAIDPALITPTLPAPAPEIGQSQDLRDNLDGAQQNDAAAKAEIEALHKLPIGGWAWEAGGVGAEPAAGALRSDGADLLTTTALRLHDINADTRDMSGVLVSMRAGDFFHVQARDGSNEFALYLLSAQPTVPAGNSVEFPGLTPLAGGGSWAAREYQVVPIITTSRFDAALLSTLSAQIAGDVGYTGTLRDLNIDAPDTTTVPTPSEGAYRRLVGTPGAWTPPAMTEIGPLSLVVDFSAGWSIVGTNYRIIGSEPAGRVGVVKFEFAGGASTPLIIYDEP